MEYAIECTGLEKRYPDFTLGPLDLNVERGTVAGLIGSNGAGKTTLIKLLLGLTSPDAGVISLFDTRITDPENLKADIKSRIGVVLDTCAFTQASRVGDVAQLGRAAYRNWDDDLFGQLTDDFELGPKKPVEKLSRGMGMKLSIAFALAHHPDLLILDEATAGLDPMARDELLDLLRGFMMDERHTILMSTHITSDLEKIADKVICIDEGHIVFNEQKESISNEAGIAHVRSDELDEVLVSGLFVDARPVLIARPFGADVLVPDRFAFARAYPNIAFDSVSIEDYMSMILKGDVR